MAFAYAASYNAPYIRYYLYDAMIDAIGCSNVQLSFLTTVSVITAAISSVPGGIVADRFSTKKCIMISVVLNLPLCVIAALFSSVYWVQLAVWAMFGFTTGFAFWPAVLTAIRVIGGRDHQSTAYGIFECCQGLLATITLSISTWVFTWFADEIVGYQMALIAMGVFAFVSGMMVMIFYKEDADAEKSLEAPKEKEKISAADVIALFRNPYLWIASISIASVYGLYISQSYLTPYFTDVLKVSVAFSGFFAIFRDSGTKVIGGPIGGVVAKIMKSSSLLMAIALFLNAGMIFGISQMRGSGSSIMVMIMAVVLLNAMICMMAKGVMWSTMDEVNIPVRLSGTAISIVTLIAIYLPDAVLPMINGSLLDTYADNLPKAYTYYFAILIGLALVGAAASLLIFIKGKMQKSAK